MCVCVCGVCSLSVCGVSALSVCVYECLCVYVCGGIVSCNLLFGGPWVLG